MRNFFTTNQWTNRQDNSRVLLKVCFVLEFYFNRIKVATMIWELAIWCIQIFLVNQEQNLIVLNFPEDWDENNDEEDKGPKTKMTRRKMMWYVVDHWSVCWCDLSGWNVGLGKRRQFVPISSTSHHHTLAPSEHLDVLGEDLQHRSVEHVVLCGALRQGCISCGILVSGIGARGVSSEHMENMEMFSCSPT